MVCDKKLTSNHPSRTPVLHLADINFSTEILRWQTKVAATVSFSGKVVGCVNTTTLVLLGLSTTD
jgi:hypothetical protein